MQGVASKDSVLNGPFHGAQLSDSGNLAGHGVHASSQSSVHVDSVLESQGEFIQVGKKGRPVKRPSPMHDDTARKRATLNQPDSQQAGVS